MVTFCIRAFAIKIPTSFKYLKFSSLYNKKGFKSNSNHHSNLNINLKETNNNYKNKKLPGISSYTQSK